MIIWLRIFVALSKRDKPKNAPVAQLDRVPDFGSGGWGFEPLRVYLKPL